MIALAVVHYALVLLLIFLFPSGILDTLAEEESNSEDEDDVVDIDLVALEAVA